jgi:orotidine-5'-phosphate decarboxylase
MDELRQHIERKQSHIILAYDKTNYKGLIEFIHMLHQDLIGIKIHSEILNLTPNQDQELYSLCQKYDLFVWEDRKFNDIANTFGHQIKKYENVRDYVSVCPLSGPDILQVESNLKYFVLIEMSSRNNLMSHISSKLYNLVLDEIGNGNIAGIICQSDIFLKEHIVTLKPGININKKKDTIGQVYTNIKDLKYKPNLIIVGRGLTNVSNPKEEIKLYKY